jgi:hypothetical protein
MTKSGFQKYLDSFKSIKGLGASIGVLVPGFVYFTKYAPPYFPGITLLTTAFATATVVITYYYSPSLAKSSTRTLPPILKSAIKAFVASILLLFVYTILLDLCTVVVPGTTQRMQIGFGRFDWSLTAYGQQVKTTKPLAPPQQWLWDESFETDAPKLIWASWTIHLAGILMTLVFMFAFVLWTFAWSLIAKQKAIKK